MTPNHGVEAKMRNVSEVFVPDFQQAQEYHKELLKQSKQEQAVLQTIKAHSKELPSSHGLGFLRRLFVRRHSQEFAGTASRSSNVRT